MRKQALVILLKEKTTLLAQRDAELAELRPRVARVEQLESALADATRGIDFVQKEYEKLLKFVRSIRELANSWEGWC